MNDRNLVRLTDETADLLARIALAIQTVDAQGCTVLDRIRDGHNGQPKAASYDRSSRAARTPELNADGEDPNRDSHLPSDPTGEAAIRFDRAAQHRKRLDALANRLHGFATEYAGILAAYQPRVATAADMAKVEDENHPSCQSCSRIEGHHGQPYYSPVHRHGTVNGNLADPLHLCYWCYTYTRQTGRLPGTRELEAHRDGKPVRRSA